MLCQTFNDVFAMLVDDFEHSIAQQDALRFDPFDAGTSAQMLVSPRPMGRGSFRHQHLRAFVVIATNIRQLSVAFYLPLSLQP